MSTLLGIFSYPGANEAVARHYEYFLRQEADWIYGIGTTDGLCQWPQGVVREIDIGENRYIDGPHLPSRMLDAIETFLLMPWDALILAEYDTVFFRPINLVHLWTVAAHHAGSQVWGSKAKGFYHNPWIFTRSAAIAFTEAGREAIANGICPSRAPGEAPLPECSPDVFFGYICESLQLPIQTDLWTEYSRNGLSAYPEHLEEARTAYQDGVQIIHGIKAAAELEYIIK